MIKAIDNFLNRTTMYRVVLYYLIVLWFVAFLFSIFGVLHYSPVSMLLSLLVILIISWATNYIFSHVYDVPANVESIYITAFILSLIITPAVNANEYIFLGWAAILAMASKYIFAVNHKHIFNPAAFAVVITAYFINQSASWWLGTFVMASFVILGGLMVVRKIRRADLTISFFFVAMVVSFFFNLFKGNNILSGLESTLFNSPILFFTFIMITEPLTTPPSRMLRILYGAIVGFLFVPQIHIQNIYFTPELALLVGNLFSYIVSPKKRLTLKLKQKLDLSPNTKEFIFESNMSLSFKPGQYLEWTLGHDNPDARGNRRYFTIASSPTEKNMSLGVRFYEQPSTFKKEMMKMNAGGTIIASQLSGDFVLPKNKNKKLVFIAGGIGITPFRSMIKYLEDKEEERDIVLIYSNKNESDIAYKSMLDSAARKLNLKIIYVISSPKDIGNWRGKVGRIDANIIIDEVKDFKDRTFYISGPSNMVTSMKEVVKSLGLNNTQIKTDFFPGFV